MCSYQTRPGGFVELLPPVPCDAGVIDENVDYTKRLGQNADGSVN